MKTRYLIAAAALLVGCAALKPIVRDMRNVAQRACELFFAEGEGHEQAAMYGGANGLSPQEAASVLCKMDEILDPFIDEILRAQGRAGGQAAPTAAEMY